jgi:hypothetical protein
MNPSPHDADDSLPPVPPVPPDTGTPKVIGILHIIFGVCLLLCGACYGLQIAAQSAMGPMMAAQQQQMQAGLEAQRQAQLKKLEDRERAAGTDEEKAAIQAEIKALRARPLPKMPDMTKLWNDGRVQGFVVTDLLTGMVLNLALLISGIGLVGRNEWGRVTGLWVLGIKLVRLVVLYGVAILVVVPVMAQKFIDFFQEMTKDMPPGQGGPRPDQLTQMGATMGTMMTATAVGVMVIGALVWGVLWWFLSRPGVKAACTRPLLMSTD